MRYSTAGQVARRLFIDRPLIASAAGAVLLVALLGYWMLSGGRSNRQPTNLSPPASPAAPVAADVLRYERRADPEDPNQFKLSFTASREACLYIISPDTGGRLTAYLTNRTATKTGEAANRLQPGKEVLFPPKGWIALSDKSARLTLVISPTPLEGYKFANATGEYVLSAEEQKALEEMRRRARQQAPEIKADRGGAIVRARVNQGILSAPLLIDMVVEQ